MTTFTTKSGMLAAGYVVPHGTQHYRGFQISSRDVSGPSSFGYRFALCASIDLFCSDEGDLIIAGQRPLPSAISTHEFCYTETVWLTEEMNKLRQPGAFVVAYPPTAHTAAMAEIRAAIDAWRETYPELPTLAERIEEAKRSAPIEAMLAALKAAAATGHPNVRIAKRSGEPVFTCQFPRYRQDGSWWSGESTQLAYLDEALAREQMAFAGIDW